MEEIRYFFSPDGAQSFGPVTIPALRRLVEDQVLTAKSYLRAEDKEEWQEIDLAFFAIPADPIPAEGAAAPPEQPAPQSEVRVPFTPRKRNKTARRPQADEPDLFTPFSAPPPDAPVSPEFVFQEPPPPAIPRDAPRKKVEPPGVETKPVPPPEVPATEVPVAVLPPEPDPPIISVPHYYAPPVRSPAPASGIASVKRVKGVRRRGRGEKRPRKSRTLLVLAILVGLAAAGVLAYFGAPRFFPHAPWLSVAASKVPAATAPAPPLELRTQGYNAKNPEEAARKIQALRDQVGVGNTEAARISRDFLDVVSELLVKTKRCDQLGKLCNFDVTTISSPADITRREAAIAQLNDAQEDVVKFLEHFNDHCRAVLVKDHFNEAAINQTIGGLRETSHVDLLITLWQAEAKLSADQIARLEFLARGRGTWTINNGKLVFPDDQALNTYNGFVHDLQDDVQTISTIQKQLRG